MDQQAIANFIPILVGFVGILVGLMAHVRLGAARRSLKLLEGTFDGQTLLDAVADYAQGMRSIEGKLRALSERQEQLFAALGRSTRNLGIVRYDAFEEMGGRLSFSAALLNDHGDGLVISSINGRTESRVYAKEVKGRVSEHTLSPEEQQAISDALGSKRRGTNRSRAAAPALIEVGADDDEVLDEAPVVARPVQRDRGRTHRL